MINKINRQISFMKTYKIITVLAFVLSAFTMSAQTYIEAGTGVRFSNIAGYLSGDYSFEGILPQNGFETRSANLKLGLVQSITHKFSVEAALQFGVQSMPYSDYGFAGWTDLRFDQYNFSLLPRYALFDNIDIGLGFTYGILSDFELGKKERKLWSRAGTEKNQRHIGWITSISYQINPITIALQYLHTDGENFNPNKLIYQIKSIELLLSYQLQVGK